MPISRSQVHLTSLAVKGVTSCHLTPRRSGKVNSVPSSLHDQLVARSGTIDCRLFCGTSCLYMIRLLKTCIIGCSAARVDSSRIDMLAGLSKCDSLSIPPCFWASVGAAAEIAVTRAPAAITHRKVIAISLYLLLLRLLVEPDIFHAPAVVDAVDHDGQPFEF